MSVRRDGVLSRRGNWRLVYSVAFLLAGLAGCGPSEQSDLVRPNSASVSINITMPDKIAAASNRRNSFWATLQRWLFPTEAWAAGGRTDLAILRVEVSAADLLTPVSGEVSVPSTGNVVTIPLNVPVGADRVFTASGLDATRARIFLKQSDAVTLNAGQPITVDIDLAAGIVGPAGSLTDARALHTATRLQNGKVLVVGGFSNQLASALASAELYDPTTNKWSKLATGLTEARSFHTATLLQNGKVLIVAGNASLASAELFDPGTQKWTSGGSLTDGRAGPTATLLVNGKEKGKVLVVGGASPEVSSNRLASAELFDPITQRWEKLPAGLTDARGGHTATLLEKGKVLVVAGDLNNSALASAELFDPETREWTKVGSLSDARERGHTATLLEDGQVLVVGGLRGRQDALASAELFDPQTHKWTPVGSLSVARSSHTATRLKNGKVLVAGGFGTGEGGPQLGSAELYDPKTEKWQNLATGLANRRGGHTATLLPNGQVLIVGGTGTAPDSGNQFALAEVLDLSLL